MPLSSDTAVSNTHSQSKLLMTADFQRSLSWTRCPCWRLKTEPLVKVEMIIWWFVNFPLWLSPAASTETRGPRGNVSRTEEETNIYMVWGSEDFSTTAEKKWYFHSSYSQDPFSQTVKKVQYLPCTQSNKIAFPALMGNYWQKSVRTKLWLGWVWFGFLQENQCLVSISWIQEQLITAHWLAITLLMQKVLNGWCLNGFSCTIPFPPINLQRSPHGLLHVLTTSSSLWAHHCTGLALLHFLCWLLSKPSQIP